MQQPEKESFAEIEKRQAELAKTIEDSKQLILRSQQLLDCHKNRKAPQQA